MLPIKYCVRAIQCNLYVQNRAMDDSRFRTSQTNPVKMRLWLVAISAMMSLRYAALNLITLIRNIKCNTLDRLSLLVPL